MVTIIAPTSSHGRFITGCLVSKLLSYVPMVMVLVFTPSSQPHLHVNRIIK
jgi:hypothetical protein